MFTVPGRPVAVLSVLEYATVAADWERLRLRVRRNTEPVQADDERFSAMTVTLRRLSVELGLTTCTAETAGIDGVAGVTGRHGMLPNDPSYLYSNTWVQSTTNWCG